ncbi:MAG: septal ring lytic transglycosylase RlpA family protein [Deltaproteobacteria bacterium]|nr:septal ring lytic transglycosylase RlpA family protein [Deltaproteobacteria bacterium]MBW1794384.1 septal ring lytic transglycosylase RlpA family protein [Deltaproteobacteria bacterium]MBW2330761.1 septal ring lytic transglycosylase RlpA family protein [Deltaproteobacteria bacterium]
MIKYPKLCNLQFAICVAISLLLLSCAAPEKRPAPIPGYPKPYKIGKHWYQPMKHARGFRERGTASWYGKDFHGRKTSSGEAYNMYAMTAAHKTLPLGTYVRVCNLNNDETVDVRINDRGPFVRGRIIDLSYEAAQRIGLVGPGTVPVKIVALGSLKETVVGGKVQRTLVPGNYYVGDFTIQVGAFKDKENAVRLRNKLGETYKNAHITVYESAKKGTFYRVRVARCKALDQARKYAGSLQANGYPDAFVVAR